MATLTSQQLIALDFLRLYEKKQAQIYGLNSSINEVFPEDFSPRVEIMPCDLNSKLICFLDVVLGEKLASYYLYECNKDCGLIQDENGRKWPIKSVDDIKRYLESISD